MKKTYELETYNVVKGFKDKITTTTFASELENVDKSIYATLTQSNAERFSIREVKPPYISDCDIDDWKEEYLRKSKSQADVICDLLDKAKNRS